MTNKIAGQIRLDNHQSTLKTTKIAEEHIEQRAEPALHKKKRKEKKIHICRFKS